MDSYRSLGAWQRSHTLCVETLRALDAVYHPPAQAVFEQLRRAVVSVETNVVEGYALGSGEEFREHLRIALGSAAQADALLNIAEELGYLPGDKLERLRRSAGLTIGALHGLLRSLTHTARVAEPDASAPVGHVTDSFPTA